MVPRDHPLLKALQVLAEKKSETFTTDDLAVATVDQSGRRRPRRRGKRR